MIDINPRMFFTAKPVQRAVSKAARAVLSKAGAFVRQRARSLIKPRKRPTHPGEPPAKRTGVLRRFIYFGYEPGSQSVVIGPARLNDKPAYGPVTAPQVLEEGGKVVADDGTVRHYRGNPHMGPALQQELPNLPKLWSNSVKKG